MPLLPLQHPPSSRDGGAESIILPNIFTSPFKNQPRVLEGSAASSTLGSGAAALDPETMFEEDLKNLLLTLHQAMPTMQSRLEALSVAKRCEVPDMTI